MFSVFSGLAPLIEAQMNTQDFFVDTVIALDVGWLLFSTFYFTFTRTGALLQLSLLPTSPSR